MWPQEETKGDILSKELEEYRGIHQMTQAVFSFVRIKEIDQMWMWMEELHEVQLLGTDILMAATPKLSFCV